MPDDEVKRLKRFIKISWGVALLLIILIVAYFSYQVGALRNEVGLVAEAKPTVIKGADGANGMNGTNGKDGTPGLQGPQGLPGKSVTADEIVAAVTAYMKANPVPSVQGQKGDTGTAAPTLTIKVNQSCQLESQYDGADSWTVLAQLPVPCEVQP